MGCSGVRNKDYDSYDLLSKPLSNKLTFFTPNTPAKIEINRLITRASNILYQFEKVRQNVIDSLDDIVLLSGAYVFLSPTIINCLNCLFFLISIDLKGNFQDLHRDYCDDAPFLMIKSSSFSQRTIDLIQLTQKYVTNLAYLKTTINQLENDIPELLYIVNEVVSEEYKRDFSDNNNMIDTALRIIPLLKSMNCGNINIFQKEAYSFSIKKEEYNKKMRIFYSEYEIQGKINGSELTDIGEIMYLYKGLALKKSNYFPLLKMEASHKTGFKRFNRMMQDKQENIKEKVVEMK